MLTRCCDDGDGLLGWWDHGWSNNGCWSRPGYNGSGCGTTSWWWRWWSRGIELRKGEFERRVVRVGEEEGVVLVEDRWRRCFDDGRALARW